MSNEFTPRAADINFVMTTVHVDGVTRADAAQAIITFGKSPVTLGDARVCARLAECAEARRSAARKLEPVNTPRAAKELAAVISAACFNDEIRAHVARELLTRINKRTSFDDVERARTSALLAASELTTAYDRQYRD